MLIILLLGTRPPPPHFPQREMDGDLRPLSIPPHMDREVSIWRASLLCGLSVLCNAEGSPKTLPPSCRHPTELSRAQLSTQL